MPETSVPFEDIFFRNRVTGILDIDQHIFQAQQADQYRVEGEQIDWTDTNKDFKTSGTLASGDLTVSGTLYINDLAPNQGNEILVFKLSGLAHGVTAHAETDAFGTFKRTNSDTGGLLISGFTENVDAIRFWPIYTNDNTAKGVTALAPFMIDVYKKNGTQLQAQGADANTFTVRSFGITRFIVDEDGDILYDGGASSYDFHNDALACRDLSMVLSKQFNQVMVYNQEKLTEMGVLRPFVSTKALNMLELGAIGQLYEKNKELEEKIQSLERKLEV